MTKIIDDLKSDHFNDVEKHHYKCPCCNGDLYTARNRMMMVLDGNTVFYCENLKEHRFWMNARERSEILHQNKNATATNWDSEQDWMLENNKWIKHE